MSTPTRFPGRIDWLLGALAAVALFMLTDWGGAIALLAMVSLIGIPVAILLWGAPLAAMVLIPWRGLFLLLRRGLPKVPALLVALAVTAGALLAVDRALPRGPNPDLAALLAQDGPIQPFAPLPDGRLGLIEIGATPSADNRCSLICRSILNQPLVEELVIRPDWFNVALRRQLPDGSCPAGWTQAPGLLCQRPAEGAAPVVLTVTPLDLATLAGSFAPDQADLIAGLLADDARKPRSMTRLALSDARDGSSAVAHLADAPAYEGGLFGLGFKGSLGENPVYGPRLENRMFASFASLSPDAPAQTTPPYLAISHEDAIATFVNRAVRPPAPTGGANP